jgi:hypothetical protein
LNEAQQLNQALKAKTPIDLQKLLGISEKLSTLNWERNQSFSIPFNIDNSRPAVFAFNGDVYTGLNACTISGDAMSECQNKLRILSGLYGILRPLDLIQPYRLEMGTSIAINGYSNLYLFWKNKLTDYLKSELAPAELVVNLASNEYASVIDFESLETPVIHPVFKDYKNGKLKIISFFAKKARGEMSRFLINNKLSTTEELLSFSSNGYSFNEAETKDPTRPVFIR